jgi:hypothetical protein
LPSETVIFDTPLAFGSCGGNFALTAILLFAALFALVLTLRRIKTRSRILYLLVGLGLVLWMLSSDLNLQREIVRLAVDGVKVKIGSCNGLSYSTAEYARADLRFEYAIVRLTRGRSPSKYLLRIKSTDGRDVGQLDLNNPRMNLEALRLIAPDVVQQFGTSR